MLRATDRHRALNIHRRLEAEAAVHSVITAAIVGIAFGVIVGIALASAVVGVIDHPFAGGTP